MLGTSAASWPRRSLGTIMGRAEQNTTISSSGLHARPQPFEASTPDAAQMDGGGWLTLWQLGRDLSPKVCNLAAKWSQPHLPVSERMQTRAETFLMDNDPSIRRAVEEIKSKERPYPLGNPIRAINAVWLNPQFVAILNREIEQRLLKRRHLGHYLIAHVIPYRLRGILLRGDYEVTALAPDGSCVTLSKRDLAGFEINLWHDRLIGGDTIHRDVRVRPAASSTAAIERAVATGQSCPQDQPVLRKASDREIHQHTSHVTAAKSIAGPKAIATKRGRPPKAYWGRKELHQLIETDLEDEGIPQPGDGRQAALERRIKDELARTGNDPSESSTRDWVRRKIDDHRQRQEADK
jgi:hypothetical protein